MSEWKSLKDSIDARPDLTRLGQRCPKCGWHVTPLSHPQFMPAGYFQWAECTEEPNEEYLAKYKYNEETGVFE
jgi:hypothetical protein